MRREYHELLKSMTAGAVGYLVYVWIVASPEGKMLIKARLYASIARGSQEIAEVFGRIGIHAEKAYHTTIESARL